MRKLKLIIFYLSCVMSHSQNLLITIYQEYINDSQERTFHDWLKFVGFEYRYNNVIISLKKELDCPLIPDVNREELSPLIIASRHIVEGLTLPIGSPNLFAAQIDILQELEGAPYYGAVHTAELLSMILEKVELMFKDRCTLTNIIACFGDSLNGHTSALFKMSPEESFMSCGANWKPANINILGVFQPVLLEGFTKQFERWAKNNAGGQHQTTYEGEYFNDYVKHIRGKKGFGEDAKMYWMKNGEIIEVDCAFVQGKD